MDKLYQDFHLKNLKKISEKWGIFYPATGTHTLTVEELAEQIPEAIAFMSNFNIIKMEIQTRQGIISIYPK
jgi:hypothetical protein